MATRKSPTITTEEAQAYYKFAESHPELIVSPYGTPEAQHNAKFVTDYFEKTWPVDLSLENMAKAWPLLKPYLKLRTENQIELGRQLSRLTPAEQEAIASWVPPTGILANDFNAAILVRYCKDHNWLVDHAHLNLASTQDRVQGVLQKDTSKREKNIDPRSHKSTDDGTPFILGDDMKRLSDGSWVSKTKQDYDREAREKDQQVAPQRTQEVDAWRQICEQLMRNGTHAQQAAQKALYERGIAEGKQPRQIASEMENLKRSYERLVSRAPF